MKESKDWGSKSRRGVFVGDNGQRAKRKTPTGST